MQIESQTCQDLVNVANQFQQMEHEFSTDYCLLLFLFCYSVVLLAMPCCLEYFISVLGLNHNKSTLGLRFAVSPLTSQSAPSNLQQALRRSRTRDPSCYREFPEFISSSPLREFVGAKVIHIHRNRGMYQRNPRESIP